MDDAKDSWPEFIVDLGKLIAEYAEAIAVFILALFI